MSQYRQHAAPGVVDDEGEAFARAVFCRFLRQATICRDIDDVIERMHIVNDNSRTFDIRLGGEARIPVSRELIVALARKKKELLALCESTLRHSKVHAAVAAVPAVPVGSAGGGGGSGGCGSGSLCDQQQQHQHQQHQQHFLPTAVIFPPPTALQAMQPPSEAPPISLPPPPASTGGSSNAGGSGGCTGGGGGGGLPGNGALASPAPASPPALAPIAGAPPPAPVVVVVQQEESSAAISGGARREDESAPSPVGAAAEPSPRQAQPPWSITTPAISAPPNRKVPVVPAPAPAPAREGGGNNGASGGPTTIFVRKVDMKVEKEELIKHFQTFGEVVAVSMNPTRGYAFVDYPSHDCVLRAVRAPRHTVCHKMLEVEIKKEPVTRRLARRLP